jgi:hypothetical protein
MKYRKYQKGQNLFEVLIFGGSIFVFVLSFRFVLLKTDNIIFALISGLIALTLWFSPSIYIVIYYYMQNTRILSSLEKIILNSAAEKLNDDIRSLWDKQVSAINEFRRPGGTVDFYCIENGRPVHDQKIIFKNKTKELLVAKAEIKLSRNNEVLTAKIWSTKGFLSSIHYNSEREMHRFEKYLRKEPEPEFSITTELLADLSCDIPGDVADKGVPA